MCLSRTENVRWSICIFFFVIFEGKKETHFMWIFYLSARDGSGSCFSSSSDKNGKDSARNFTKMWNVYTYKSYYDIFPSYFVILCGEKELKFMCNRINFAGKTFKQFISRNLWALFYWISIFVRCKYVKLNGVHFLHKMYNIIVI